MTSKKTKQISPSLKKENRHLTNNSEDEHISDHELRLIAEKIINENRDALRRLADR